ncbi:uncharacterized protein LOC118739876 [Rhagoletis pomonella]|uniref:uncharacterized protein LOC118739876 n=1 Tax=Rhagoletis pomonella TaxID=28610 RepID=UPI001782900A|nr:uncharacterized protein LOC118739876 [Rhagoletis pomonella]
MSLSYATLVNTCDANKLAKQTINSKPQQYTPRKALNKAFKLLRRVFKPSTSVKVINKAEQQITAQKSLKVAEKQKRREADAAVLSEVNALCSCSAISAEEYENFLNELAELQAAASNAIAAE